MEKSKSHLDAELQLLKKEAIAMWELVALQLKKTHESLVKHDRDLAREVVMNEKRVNAYELKIDRDCENIFALFTPVAVDLRFVLAILKINNNLERTGDIAEGISKFIVNTEKEFDRELLERTRVVKMFEEAHDMIRDVLAAFREEDSTRARSIFRKDEILDDINISASREVAAYIRSNPDNTEQALNILSTIRKLERVGDQAKNMAEEIIFYMEAKVLKHKKKEEGGE